MSGLELNISRQVASGPRGKEGQLYLDVTLHETVEDCCLTSSTYIRDMTCLWDVTQDTGTPGIDGSRDHFLLPCSRRYSALLR